MPMVIRTAIVASLLLATPALAAEPATIILPTPVVTALGNYLAGQPYKDVAGLMQAIQQCVAVQLPNAQGAIVSHGECPAVTAALAKAHEAAAPKPKP